MDLLTTKTKHISVETHSSDCRMLFSIECKASMSMLFSAVPGSNSTQQSKSLKSFLFCHTRSHHSLVS